MNKLLFYFLSFTWGLPMTLIGIVVGFILTVFGKRSERWGSCQHFKVGKNWGGVTLGLVIITDETPSEHIKKHEHGHAIQNCYFGFLMPFVVCIPSAVRYWYRTYRDCIGKPCVTQYDDIWFEADATRLGNIYVNKWN